MKLRDYKVEDWDRRSILEIIDIGVIKIILLKVDLTVLPKREGRKNLLAIDKEDNIVWVAKFPNDSIYESYDHIKLINNSLMAWCGSYLCKIDSLNGLILDVKFIK